MVRVRVLLLSTYEMGHQPLQLAGPSARLRSGGHQVRTVDLAVESMDGMIDVDWADVVGVSVPMHTAMRLAVEVISKIHQSRPGVPIACYGLYASMSAGLGGVEASFAGEFEDALVQWVESRQPGIVSSSDRVVPSRPDRASLPDLERYAHLQIDGEHRRVGYVEASRGCRHRCAHCPIPVVYDGRFWPVPIDVVLDDIDGLVGLGARHVTFGDPDFLNGPVHALRVLEGAHGRHPDLTFDVTVKVEHLLRHRDLLPRLAASGVLFVTSAFESVDDRTLRLLDKGHDLADLEAVVPLVHGAGISIHPTWLPFTPITTPEDVVGIFRFLDRHELFGVTDPVQLSIRLLVPAGSLVLEIPEFAHHIEAYDEATLGHRWISADPRSDALQSRLSDFAAAHADVGGDPSATLVEMWAAALAAAGADPGQAQIPAGAIQGRPRLTEPWFC